MASGRNPAVAGSFYPADPAVLKNEITNYFSKSKRIINNKTIRAVLVPHAGTIYSGRTAAWGYWQLPHLKSPHFVLIGPSHHVAFGGLASSDAGVWQTPLGVIPHVPPKTLSDDVIISDEAHETEHDIEVQLPFLQTRFSDFSFTAFLAGTTINAHSAATYVFREYPASVCIISSDLSHYLPDEEARSRDAGTIEAILTGNKKYVETEDNVACGASAITIAMDLALTHHWSSQLIRYDTSASAFGDTSRVVGYASIIWYEE